MIVARANKNGLTNALKFLLESICKPVDSEDTIHAYPVE